MLKGTRWLLLKNRHNLNEQKNEKERLDEALKLNKPLATACCLKEDLKRVWLQDCKVDAKKYWTNGSKKPEVPALRY
ncbi:MAG: transposase [Deltaproteobacteria bacterium]|nr:transposase [Deltaproteobacteria bacterium]